MAVTHTELILVHPFREGNGRLTRLLNTLMALQAGLPGAGLWWNPEPQEAGVHRCYPRRAWSRLCADGAGLLGGCQANETQDLSGENQGLFRAALATTTLTLLCFASIFFVATTLVERGTVGLNGAKIPSMADDVAIVTRTARLRSAAVARYLLVWARLAMARLYQRPRW